VRTVIAHGLPIYVALEPVDMRMGAERLGAMVRERMRAEPRSRALFVFVGKRRHSMKVLTWDGTGTIATAQNSSRARPPPAATSEGSGAVVPTETFDATSDAVAKLAMALGSAIADVVFAATIPTARGTTPREL
jgi:transposase